MTGNGRLYPVILQSCNDIIFQLKISKIHQLVLMVNSVQGTIMIC